MASVCERRAKKLGGARVGVCYVLAARELEDSTQTLLAWSVFQQDRGNYTIFFLFQLCILRMNLQDKNASR